MRVLELGLGFGPKLFSIKRGGTVYSLNLIPVLAFVRLAGIDEESEDEKDCPNNEKYFSKTAFEKFKAIVAGPLMNICLGFVIFSIFAFSAGLPEMSFSVGSVIDGSPAQRAGLKPKDVITSFQGEKVSDPLQMITTIHKSPDKKIVLEVVRNGKTVKISAVAAYDKKVKAALLGFSLEQVTKRYGPIRAVWAGAEKTAQITLSVITVLGGLFLGKISITDLAGPIGIAQFSGQVASKGFGQFMLFTAFISINLGVLNLLPIPALDGGRLVFIIIEAIRGKAIKIETENKIHQWGLIFLLVIMFIVSINDVLRIAHLDTWLRHTR